MANINNTEYFSYNKDSYELIGHEIAESDVNGLLLPADATFETPLSKAKGLLEGYVNIFAKPLGTWIQVKDMRGEVFNKSTKEHAYNELITTLDKRYTKLEPKEFDKWDTELNIWVKDLEEERKDIKNKIKIKYGTKELSGIELFAVDLDLNGEVFDADFGSITKLKGALDLNRLINNKSITVRTYNNKSIKITNSQLEKIIIFLGIKYQELLRDMWEEIDRI